MKKKSFWYHARNPEILKTSAKTALLVGTIYALINYFESIFAMSLNSTQIIKIVVSYFVPFSVATYAAVRHAQREE
jgi:hypothetical protein